MDFVCSMPKRKILTIEMISFSVALQLFRADCRAADVHVDRDAGCKGRPHTVGSDSFSPTTPGEWKELLRVEVATSSCSPRSSPVDRRSALPRRWPTDQSGDLTIYAQRQRETSQAPPTQLKYET